MEKVYTIQDRELRIGLLTIDNIPQKIIIDTGSGKYIATLDIKNEIVLETMDDEGRISSFNEFSFDEYTQEDKYISFNAQNDMFCIQIRLCIDETFPCLIKKVDIFNKSSIPQTIARVYTISWNADSDVHGGGVGLPVYIGDSLFAGVAHPYAMSESEGSRLCLYHNPGEKLETGNVLHACDTIIGISKSGNAHDFFTEYISANAKNKGKYLSIYGDWALHDELGEKGYSVELTEDITMDNIGFLKSLKDEYDIHFDYYLMDHGWYDPNGKYLKLKKPNWRSDNFDKVMKALSEIETKLGLWFSVNNYFRNADGIGCGLLGDELADSRSTDSPSDGSYCLSSEPYFSTLKNALLYWAENGIDFFKIDFMNLNCKHSIHGKLPVECCIEKDSNALLDILSSVSQVNRDAIIVAFNGFSNSPWWFKYLDTLFVGDPQPCNFPSVRLRTSINMYNDRCVHKFADLGMPRPLIDDCGTMVGNTTTIFYTGIEDWRSMALLSAGRGPAFLWYYGNYHLFNDADKQFLSDILKTMGKYKVQRKVTENIGMPDGKDIYGYSHVVNNEGFVVLYNPLLCVKEGTISLKGKQLCYKLYPMEAKLIDFSNGNTVLSSGKISGYNNAENLKLQKIISGNGSYAFDGETGDNGSERRIVVYLKFSKDGGEYNSFYICREVSIDFIINDAVVNYKFVPSRFTWNSVSWLCVETDRLHINGNGKITIDVGLKNVTNVDIDADGWLIS